MAVETAILSDRLGKPAPRRHPNFERFLDWKRRLDPRQRFQSTWYRHYRDLLASSPAELAA